MIALACTLSFVCFILNVSLFFRLQWPDCDAYLWICQVITGGLSPLLVVLGLLGAGLGWIYGAPIAVVAGLMGAGISVFYIARVTISQPDFELAFGKKWQHKIPPVQETRLLPKRWNLGFPRTKEPCWERDLQFWTIPCEASRRGGTDRKLLCDLWQPPVGVVPTGLAFIYLHGICWYLFDKDFGTRPFFRQLAAQGRVIMDERIIVNLDRYYGNPTSLAIESPTLPPGRFNLRELRPAHFPPGLREASLPCPTEAGCQLGIPGIINIDEHN